VTLRSIKLKGLQILSTTPTDDTTARATVDYSFSFKRKIDDKGVKIKVEQPVTKVTQRATFLRNEGQRWLLLDSVDVPAAAAKGVGGGEAAAAAGGQ